MIIDANVHATLDGSWFATDLDASLAGLLAAMDREGVDRAVLTGLAGPLPTPDVLALCGSSDGRLLPVGAFDPAAHPDADAVRRAARAELLGQGLLGVKLHPRLGRYDVLDDRVLALLDELECWDERLAVWICTLLQVPGLRSLRGPVESICELVGSFSGLKFVLVHGGGPDLLRLATAVRPAENALLDLSYTLTHLSTGSVGLDLQLLLRTFERRLVFGSDHPEGEIGPARARLEELASAETVELVLGENLARALPATVSEQRREADGAR
jgi:predicted TIM-barrel fold metal-dependent hydrolase